MQLNRKIGGKKQALFSTHPPTIPESEHVVHVLIFHAVYETDKLHLMFLLEPQE